MTKRLKNCAAAGLSAALIFGLAGCNIATEDSKSSFDPTTCITNFDAETDYFADKIDLKYATNFKVEYHKSYKVITMPATDGTSADTKYVLVQCGAPDPEMTGDLEGALKVQIPSKRVAADSTTQLPAFEMLNQVDAVVGIGSPSNVNSKVFNEKIAAGAITGFSDAEGSPDQEKLVAMKPDLVMQSGMPSPVWDKLIEMGIPVIADNSWMEATPLGRAEWLKYEALFLNQEKLATEQFDSMDKRYQEIKIKIAESGADKPTVLAGSLTQGKWSVPAPESHVAQMIADAGGDYVFKDESIPTGTNMDAEKVYAKGSDADIWLNGNWMSLTHWTSEDDVIKEDSRVKSLKAFKEKQIWNPTAKISEGGGNDYWESGVMHPEYVLADIGKILHPDLFADFDFIYYQKLG